MLKMILMFSSFLFLNWNMNILGMCVATFFFSLMFFKEYQFLIWSSYFHIDWISNSMILLTFWISILAIIMSNEIKNKNMFSNMFKNMILIMTIILLMFFISTNMFYLYIMFEMSLIPIFILILGWGGSVERLEAGTYIMMYMIMASLPLLLSIMITLNFNNSIYIPFFYLFKNMNIIIHLMLIMAFIVKMPLFFFHLWLPKAHVEAPLAGSMILAGILLKLSGYGLIRILPMLSMTNNNLNKLLISLSLISSFYVTLICMNQTDLKKLIAYSSVSHMSIMFASLLSLYSVSISSTMAIMLAHGFCSSALFCLATIPYFQTSSRKIIINKGLTSLIPSMSLWWFLFCFINMAAPPSLNFISEVLFFISLTMWSKWTLIFLSLICLFGCLYNIMLYLKTQHNTKNSSIYPIFNNNHLFNLVMYLHIYPIILLPFSNYFI
uniref:NADH dehydrogenase subunit 4 n=1 Tax=Spelaeomysis bottazzii TaxID=2970448 RepID=UPI002176DDEB|nr:NADH dehydrogenase subunit 4 [Spelaeomysis bottazzii]UUL70729.1 NADH dehydrogenase subunit 4 [Spelaeomysis bottazzii]